MADTKLTSYSHGAGCGCKISPAVLETILKEHHSQVKDPQLLVGNDTRDDAAVYDLGNGSAIISTTDFFMPIVDDPAEFGAIASANALSDVYAMGGKPLMAIAILGWPINSIDPAIANHVLEGSRAICRQAGITLAGGHSIDSPEPIFGLSATGLVDKNHIQKNSTAKANSHLYLTKPLGVGLVTTAEKKGLAHADHLRTAKDSMLKLNKEGEWLGGKSYVNAMTDVTGFGLLGHLSEICAASQLKARIRLDLVPKFSFVETYIDQNCIPGGTHRNWDSYGHKVGSVNERQKALLADPQTSGGLLISIDDGFQDQFEADMQANGLELVSFGELSAKGDVLIEVL